MADVAEALFECLRVASHFASLWLVRPPHEYDGGRWEFGGWADKDFRVPGVEAAEFEVRNFES